jgi:hypothetical protein
MTGELSLGELRTRAQQRADRLNSLFVTTPEWNYFINNAMFELYDMLITLYEDQYVAPIPVQFLTNGSTFLYPLPDGVQTYTNGITGQGTFVAPPFYKLIGVDLGLNTANQAFVTVRQFNFADRNRYLYPNSASTIYGVFNLEYRLLGNNIQFIPTPSANQPIRLWYIPRLKELLADTDTTTTGISGWLQYVICRAAKYALDKEESDTSVITQELLFLKQRIEESAMNRDAGMPQTIVDVNPFGNNGSMSPFSGIGKGGFVLMPPFLSSYYKGYHSLAHTVLCSQLMLRYVFFGVAASYFLYLLKSKFSSGITFTRVRFSYNQNNRRRE